MTWLLKFFIVVILVGRLFGYLLLIPFRPPLKVSVNWLIFANTIKLMGRSFTLCDLICLSHINKLPSIATKNSQVVRKNLDQMIRMIRSSGASVLLVGVELPPNYGKNYTENFKKIFDDLAQEYQLILINGSIQEMTEMGLMQSDGIHPNKGGHELVAKEVWIKLQPLLLKLSAS